jgi:hypothetical protein
VPKGKVSLWAENCPNFSFFLFGPGYFNYDKIFERGTTRLWVILIMGLPLLKFSLPPVGNLFLNLAMYIYHQTVDVW